MAYIAGHLLHALGDWLDFLYDHVYLPLLRREYYKAVRLKKENGLECLRQDKDLSLTLVARAYVHVGDDSAGTSLYDWCLSLARLRSSSAAAEVDRYQADSKFFRSLTIVLLAAGIVAMVTGFCVAAIVAFLVRGLFSVPFL